MTGKIAVLGMGAWGTALAASFATSGHDVMLWGRSKEQVERIQQTRINKKYLPETALPSSITYTNEIEVCVHDASIVLMVIPAQQMSLIAEEVGRLVEDGTSLISCAKGIEKSSGKTMSAILAQAAPKCRVGVLSGPSFAADVVQGLPTAVTIASSQMADAMALCKTLSGSKFRCYASDDLIGVDYGGALKNVLAIAAGIVQGRQLGASALAAMTARGFAELQRMALALGAMPETLTGLSGLGDLILTCASEKSRNFSYGAAIGRGDDLSNLKLAEGVATASIASKIARENGIDAPIIQTVSAILAQTQSVDEAIHMLLSRPVRREAE